jgi:hypothetical protein
LPVRVRTLQEKGGWWLGEVSLLGFGGKGPVGHELDEHVVEYTRGTKRGGGVRVEECGQSEVVSKDQARMFSAEVDGRKMAFAWKVVLYGKE